jgi:hypothetical protein
LINHIQLQLVMRREDEPVMDALLACLMAGSMIQMS